MAKTYRYISVDIEAAGTFTPDYSLLSIGAVDLETRDEFYVELKPVNRNTNPDSMKVVGVPFRHFEENGTDPKEAMEKFGAWLEAHRRNREEELLLVAYNAPFDWQFVNYYFMHFLGKCPFGYTCVDAKAYWLGLRSTQKEATWTDTQKSRLPKRIQSLKPHTHNALDDAREQADVFQNMLNEAARIRRGEPAPD
jgi:DNA polymerase III epsilon subunit-like protein